MQKRFSVRTYFWLLALAVAVLCAGVLVYSIASDARHNEREMGATTLNLAQLVAAQTQQFLTDAENIATKLAQRPMIRALDSKQRDPIFDQFLDSHPQFANLILSDASGRVIHSALPAPVTKPLETIRAQWVQGVLRNGQFTVGKPIVGQVTRRWVCVLAYPVRDRAGKISGALGMSVDLARFRIVVSPVELPGNSIITIIDQDGTVIMRSPSS